MQSICNLFNIHCQLQYIYFLQRSYLMYYVSNNIKNSANIEIRTLVTFLSFFPNNWKITLIKLFNDNYLNQYQFNLLSDCLKEYVRLSQCSTIFFGRNCEQWESTDQNNRYIWSALSSIFPSVLPTNVFKGFCSHNYIEPPTYNVWPWIGWFFQKSRAG